MIEREHVGKKRAVGKRGLPEKRAVRKGGRRKRGLLEKKGVEINKLKRKIILSFSLINKVREHTYLYSKC